MNHEHNKGKGRALKTAFQYVATLSNRDEFVGVVTADSDGQHQVEDILRVAESMREHPDALVLGCRDFDDASVPPKSKFGNKLTRFAFLMLYQSKITDTQTGLRGIPMNLLPAMLEVEGEGFEYETKMLLYAILHHIPFEEVTIQTVYYDHNSETHFHPIKDSLKIYRVLLTTFFYFTISSVSSFVLDVLLFQFFYMIALWLGQSVSMGILQATIGARVLSCMVNFFLNKNLVFKGETSIQKTAYKYFSLVVVQMTLSAFLVMTLNTVLGGVPALTKMLVDFCLFLLSYQIQQRWVFKK